MIPILSYCVFVSAVVGVQRVQFVVDDAGQKASRTSTQTDSGLGKRCTAQVDSVETRYDKIGKDAKRYR